MLPGDGACDGRSIRSASRSRRSTRSRFACIVFVLVGAPLGMRARRGGLAAGFLSVVFFLFYWACLIGGEQLADRGLLSSVDRDVGRRTCCSAPADSDLTIRIATAGFPEPVMRRRHDVRRLDLYVLRDFLLYSLMGVEPLRRDLRDRGCDREDRHLRRSPCGDRLGPSLLPLGIAGRPRAGDPRWRSCWARSSPSASSGGSTR